MAAVPEMPSLGQIEAHWSLVAADDHPHSRSSERLSQGRKAESGSTGNILCFCNLCTGTGTHSSTNILHTYNTHTHTCLTGTKASLTGKF